MAIGAPVARGTAVSGSNSSSLALVPIGTLVVGHAAIVAVEGDNPGSGVFVSSVTDTAGNAWSLLHEYINSAGVAVSVWRAHLTTQLTTASTITINFGSTTTDKCAGLIDVSIGAGVELQNGATPVENAVSAAAGFDSAVFSGLASLQRLYLRVCGKEANSTTALTATTNFTNSGWAVRSRNNTNAQILRTEWRVNTSTGETSNPTLAVTGDTASVFLALIEALPTRSAEVDQTVPDFTQVATGQVITVRSADVDQTISDFAQVAGAAVGIEAEAAQTLSTFAQTATGTVTGVRTADVDQTIPDFTQAASGGPIAVGEALQAVPVFAQTASGEPVAQCAANQLLGTFAQTFTGAAACSANVGQTLGGFTQTAAGDAVTGGNVDQTVAAFGQSTDGGPGASGAAAQTVATFIQIATGQVSEAQRFAQVNQIIPAFGGGPLGSAGIQASVAVPLATFIQIATGSVETSREVVDPILVIVPPVNLISRYDGQQLTGAL